MTDGLFNAGVHLDGWMDGPRRKPRYYYQELSTHPRFRISTARWIRIRIRMIVRASRRVMAHK
jgi:hypothetical protein